jgi:flagellum-specific peptidoglycan hydrolase FlgJ
MTASYKRAGLNDNAIKNLIAKNALESGWGRSA